MGGVRAFRPERVPEPRGLEFALPTLPLDVEVGCGVGMHPIRYAMANPERFLAAIEHTRTRFSLFESRLAHHPPISNLRALHADAVSWITHRVPPRSVERYFFLYPNPYPKAKDLNKRWHAMPFMAKVIETMKPGATLSLATNERFYVEEAERFFRREWGLKVETARALPRDFKARTHFEKKYLARGETCYELIAVCL